MAGVAENSSGAVTLKHITCELSREKNQTLPFQKSVQNVKTESQIIDFERKKQHQKQNEPDIDSQVQGSTVEKTTPSSFGQIFLTNPLPGNSRPPSTTPSCNSACTSKSRVSLKTPEAYQQKKVPMNKIQVGNAQSPNLKDVRSKIGSLDNASHKPGGGNVKIESLKIEIKATSKIEAKNLKYVPKGGDKKIVSNKLHWNVKSKIGSLENSNYKPGGGDKKIDTIKTNFKDKAKPKVDSKGGNAKNVPGQEDVKNHTMSNKSQELDCTGN